MNDLKAGRTMAAKAGWQGFSQSHFSKRTARNVNALILWVLRESILEQKKDLALHADKVRFYNEQKKRSGITWRGCARRPRSFEAAGPCGFCQSFCDRGSRRARTPRPGGVGRR